MLTLLSDKEINQLHAHLTELAGTIENLTLILGGAQTVAFEVDQAVTPAFVRTPKADSTAKSQVKTRKSRRGKRGVSVLTERKVAEIKRQLASGTKSVARIAQDFGVHFSTINAIKWGKTWKNVEAAKTAPLEIVEIHA